MIANPSFTPSFKVLAHTDEAQIPFQVVRLDFRSEKQVLGAIAPHGDYAEGSPVMNGYRIAQHELLSLPQHGCRGWADGRPRLAGTWYGGEKQS